MTLNVVNLRGGRRRNQLHCGEDQLGGGLLLLMWTLSAFSRSETRNSFAKRQDKQTSSRRKRGRVIAGFHRPDSGPGTPLGSRLPVQPALHPAAGSRPRAGLRLRRDHPLQVLQRGVSPRPLQPRPHPHQPAAQRAAAPPGAQGDVAQRSLLQAHPPRGRSLPR